MVHLLSSMLSNQADQLCRRCLQADKRSGVVFHVAVHGGGQLGIWKDCDGGEQQQKLKIKRGTAMGAVLFGVGNEWMER